MEGKKVEAGIKSDVIMLSLFSVKIYFSQIVRPLKTPYFLRKESAPWSYF